MFFSNKSKYKDTSFNYLANFLGIFLHHNKKKGESCKVFSLIFTYLPFYCLYLHDFIDEKYNKNIL